MTRQVVVVIDDLDDIGPIERFMVDLARSEDVGFHVVSTDEARMVVAPETAPRRLRLMLLMARLADRLIPVTGEVVGRELGELGAAITRRTPDEVLVASRTRRVDRVLRRDLASRMRRTFAVDARPLPMAA